MSAEREDPPAIARIPAQKPERETVELGLGGRFAGWRATVLVDFPASVVADLDSGSLPRVIAAIDALVIEHNFPDEHGHVAASMGEVDPFTAVLELSKAIGTAVGSLSKR